MSADSIVEQQEKKDRETGAGSQANDEGLLEAEKIKAAKSQRLWRREWFSMWGNVAGFALWLTVVAYLNGQPGMEIAYHSAALISLLLMMQHWIFTLVCIAVNPGIGSRKLFEFAGVFILGPVGSLLYTLFVSRRRNAGKVVPA